MSSARRTAIAALLALLAAVLVAPVQAVAEPARTAQSTEYVVLYDQNASAASAKAAIAAAGGIIVSENAAVGVATVASANADFAETVRASRAISGVARNRSIGSVPVEDPRIPVERSVIEATTRAAEEAAAGGGGDGGDGAEPFADLQWNMEQIGATPEGSYAVERGSHDVLVAIVDTGVDASHPDIAPNFNHELSRNFTVDIPVDANGNPVDGPCEFDDCIDPPTVDHNEHGTHVAGIVGAAINGQGVAGVAPDVSLVNLRAGQDSGFFFLQPTVDALTFAGDHGIDVANMSFFVDPWLYNCGNNPADSPEERAEQVAIRDAVQRAVTYARDRGVTLIAASGNEAFDQTKPTVDEISPDFADTPGEAPKTREIDPEDCATVPTESEGVLSVSATGISGRKAFYASFGLGFVDVAAPGGDGWDNPAQTLDITTWILSPLPEFVAFQNEYVDANGTPVVEGVIQDEKGAYYQYLLGTSMASPHAAGVAALIVSAFGHQDKDLGGLTLSPDEVAKRLLDTATETPCPDPPEFTYTRNLVDPETGETTVDSFTVVCEGDAENNGFFGHGVVSAVNAVSTDH